MTRASGRVRHCSRLLEQRTRFTGEDPVTRPQVLSFAGPSNLRWLVVTLVALTTLSALPAAQAGRKAKNAGISGIGSSALDALIHQIPGVSARSSSAEYEGEPIIPPGESRDIAMLEGPAVIDRLWIAVEGADTFWRDVLIRVTWDDNSGPSIEAPLGDFFAVGPGARQDLQSVPFAVHSAGRSMTSLWKMPFAKSARITLVNEGIHEVRQLHWEVDYRKLRALPEGTLYFHAQYSQANPPSAGEPVTVLRAAGRGQYVGLALVVQTAEPGPWGNGAIHFDVDSDASQGPGALGLTNYFGNIFGVSVVHGAFQGVTLDEGDRMKARTSVYRFHVHDPVPFAESIEVQLDHGVNNERKDRLGAVAFWYQDSPQVPFNRIASARDRKWDAPTDEELALWRRADELNVKVLEAYRRSDFAEAQTLLEELITLEPNSVYASYNLACLYALHGELDKSLHMLEQAIELGFTELSFARHDPDLAAHHGNERFQKMVGIDGQAGSADGGAN